MLAADAQAIATDAIFKPFALKGLTLKNRVVMAAMTQCTSPGQIPSQTDIDYYVARAKGGVALIMAGSVTVDCKSGSNELQMPAFFGEQALRQWDVLRQEVQNAGALIMPQLHHVGATRFPGTGPYPDSPILGPSGLAGPGNKVAEPMSLQQIRDVIDAFVRGAVNAKKMGFDGVEIHAAHGYLLDQFLWEGTNQRTDAYGGSLEKRGRFVEEIIAETRRAVGPDFPIVLRISQWKIQDYAARVVTNPAELERFLTPFVKAGADMFHCSLRRFWEAEFPETGSNANLAAWTKKISGLPSIAIGSVGLSGDIFAGIFAKANAEISQVETLNAALRDEEFDLIAIGRALLANPDWVNKVQQQRFHELAAYDPAPRDDFIDNTGYDH